MEYLVMECGRGYAIVLDSEGRFLKVPNLGYEVGQVLDHVVIFDSTSTNIAHKKRVACWIAAAACICLFIMGGLVWQTPVGTVRMQINPDVQMSVNFFDRVVGLDGLNEDGKDLIDGYHVYGKTTEAASYGLADHAIEMGYLSSGGKITLIVESKNSEWKTVTEEKLLLELEIHFDNRIVITTISAGSSDESDDSQGYNMTDPSKDFPQDPQEWNDGSVEYENEDFEQNDSENLNEDTDEDLNENLNEGTDKNTDNYPSEDTDDEINDDIDDDKYESTDEDTDESPDNYSDEDTDNEINDDIDDDKYESPDEDTDESPDNYSDEDTDDEINDDMDENTGDDENEEKNENVPLYNSDDNIDFQDDDDDNDYCDDNDGNDDDDNDD